ncbi:MAG: hypothetical protein M1816_007188 [Peltula sp. TS41687]|nr:MAG: hypothetical protein M1816_007188 [Peltula sp. TS41687]
MSGRFLPREGLTAEPIWRLIKATLLNPLLTLPILLYSNRSRDATTSQTTTTVLLQTTRALFYLGLTKWLSDLLSRGAVNNWRRDRYDWKREVIVVTGGSDGIGGRVVQHLARAQPGLKAIVVLDIQAPTYALPANAFFYSCDITSPSTVGQVAATIRAAHGDATVLINNAGVARGKTLLESSEADVRLTFDVNALAHYWLLHAFLPAMVAADHGMVVTVASLASYAPLPQMVDYASSKAAALSLHEGLAAELVTRYHAPRVRTVAVTQGFTRTALFEGYTNKSTWLMAALEVDTVAEAIVAQVLRGESAHLVLPATAAFVCGSRGWPLWFTTGMRKNGSDAMSVWKGRQVFVDEVLEGRYKKS